MGKTALAVDVARVLDADFDGAVAVVELAAVREAALVLPAVARALGVRQLAEPLVDGLAAVVGVRRQLVVLDNVEHVLAGGAGRRRAAGALPGPRDHSPRAGLRCGSAPSSSVPWSR